MFRFPTTLAPSSWPRWIALGLVVGVMSSSTVFAQAPAPAKAQAARNPYVFTMDGAVLLNFVKPDKTADFEMVMAKLKEALAKSQKPERKQQAAAWKVFKAAEAGAGGAGIYVSIIDPALKGADYTVSTILAEEFPAAETNELFKKYAESLSTPPGNLLNLTLLFDLGK